VGPRLFALLLLPLVLAALFAVPQAHATYYYSPPTRTIRGSLAYVPGFELIVLLGQSTGTGVQISLSRANNFTTETCDPQTRTGTCGISGYDNGIFTTDTVNTYDIVFSVNYTIPVNQTIHIRIFSAGDQVDDYPIWVVASYIRLPFTIVTSKSPQSAEAIADALSQRQQQRDQAFLSRLGSIADKLDSLQQSYDQNMTIIYSLLAIPVIVAVVVARNHLKRRD